MASLLENIKLNVSLLISGEFFSEHYGVLNLKMTVNYEVGRIWKLAIVAHFRYIPNIFLEQLQGTIKRSEVRNVCLQTRTESGTT
jgi:hypothetical protein